MPPELYYLIILFTVILVKKQEEMLGRNAFILEIAALRFVTLSITIEQYDL